MFCFVGFFLKKKKIKRHNVIFDLRNFVSYLDQYARLALLTYLRPMQFIYTERGNFPDDFMSFNEISNFYTPMITTLRTIL